MDIGDGVSRTVRISEGYALSYIILHLDLTGHDFTVFSMKTITMRDYISTPTAELEIMRNAKEFFTLQWILTLK